MRKLYKAFRGTPGFPGNHFEPHRRGAFHSTDNNKPFLSCNRHFVRSRAICWDITHFLLAVTDVSEVYCLHLQIGLQLQYLPVFTALYPIRLQSFNSAFVYKSEFQNFKSSIKNLIQRTEQIGGDVVLSST